MLRLSVINGQQSQHVFLRQGQTDVRTQLTAVATPAAMAGLGKYRVISYWCHNWACQFYANTQLPHFSLIVAFST